MTKENEKPLAQVGETSAEWHEPKLYAAEGPVTGHEGNTMSSASD